MKTSADDVYHGLWEDIRRGVTPPGSPVGEEALAERFGVSRTPVREALRRLAQDGLLERSTRGLVVTRLSAQKMREMYPIVAVLEGLAAAEMTRQRDETLLDELMRLNQDMHAACAEENSDRFIDLNAHFHAIVIDHSGNPSLIAALQRFRAMVHHYRVLSLHIPGRMASAVDEHRCLIEAIQSGNSEAAEAAMRHHIHRSQAVLAATLSVLDLHAQHVESTSETS
ncbi:MAG: GntR family transcriptional regulator [Chloroflexota bacterium]